MRTHDAVTVTEGQTGRGLRHQLGPQFLHLTQGEIQVKEDKPRAQGSLAAMSAE